MNPQPSSPLRAYPNPIPSDAPMSSGPEYFTARRPQPLSLSQEDQNLANSLSHDMGGHMGVLSPQLANGQAQSFAMGTQGGLPQTPQQPTAGASIASQHSGTDPNQDLSYGMGTDRRKRSKVSRACDECRRKKVRCDSTTSDSNVVETCSNCRRLKLTCQFERAPMKRGPSKGYIKELAERVQQVESQMGLPVGYRPSVDAGSPSDPYAEQSFSPTEIMSSSTKRTFSQFDGRNPFTQSPQSARDKVPSLSGYNINQAPQSERASFAIAPDQQLMDVSPTAGAPPIDLTKPFWAQDTEIEHPRAKETQAAEASACDAWEFDSLFSAYVALIHNDISILPRSFETVQSHISKCPQELASAFTYVLAVACGSKPPDGHYTSDSEVEDYAWTNARVLPLNRHHSENIVSLWLYIFMVINVNADVSRLRGTKRQLSKRTILKMAIDLGQFLLAAIKQDDGTKSSNGLDPTQNIVQRTCSCISILAQLDAIGTGTEDPVSSSDWQSLSSIAELRALLPEPVAFLSALASILSLLSNHTPPSAFSRLDLVTSVKTRKIIESGVNIILSTFPPSSASSSLFQEAQLFISLLLARHTFVNDPSEILDLAVKLTDILDSDPVNPHGHQPPVAKTLDIHLYTLTGFTLLELIDSEDVDLVKSSQNSLAKLRHALEQVSEGAHVRQQSRFPGGRLGDISYLHWADALLGIIDAKREIDQDQRPSRMGPEEAGHTNGPNYEQPKSSINGSSDNGGRIQVISTHQQYLISRLTNVAAIQNTIRANGTKLTVVDFSLLTRRGYLNVLAELNGF